ncbi:MAG: type II secretion system protein N [Gammaproteobacteria bacterium]|nr:MAG: type II secretion system protein N [Gammaproteobacteria bacterium]
MSRFWRFLVLGTGAYLLIMVATFPARQAVGFLETQVPGLSVQAVEGTIFSGQAGQLAFDGQVLGQLDWSFRPLALPLGRIEYRITLDGPVFTGSGNLGAGPGVDLVAHDVTGEIQPDPLLERYVQGPVTVQTEGPVMLTLDTLRIEDGFPDELVAVLHWKDAALLEPVELALGQVEVNLGSTGDSVAGEIGNTAAGTDVSGDFSILATGKYRFQLLVKPGPATTAEFIDMLGSFGEPQAGGAYLITDSGEW